MLGTADAEDNCSTFLINAMAPSNICPIIPRYLFENIAKNPASSEKARNDAIANLRFIDELETRTTSVAKDNSGNQRYQDHPAGSEAAGSTKSGATATSEQSQPKKAAQ